MPLMTSDQHVTGLFAKHLEPGETDLVYAYAEDGPPIWLRMMVLGAVLSFFLTKYYFVGVTERRLLLMRLRANYKEKETVAFPLRDLQDVSSKKVFLGRSLRFTTPDGRRHRLLLRNRLIGLGRQKEYAARLCERALAPAGATEQPPPAMQEPPAAPTIVHTFYTAPAVVWSDDGRRDFPAGMPAADPGFHTLPRGRS
jgi:hypothetical protein